MQQALWLVVVLGPELVVLALALVRAQIALARFLELWMGTKTPVSQEGMDEGDSPTSKWTSK